VCIVGLRNYTETGRHPTGLAERAYSWATSASLLLFAWVIVEVLVAKTQRWKCIAFLILSLLMLLMTKLVTDGLLIGE
jgi:hypothetical protein